MMLHEHAVHMEQRISYDAVAMPRFALLRPQRLIYAERCERIQWCWPLPGVGSQRHIQKRT